MEFMWLCDYDEMYSRYLNHELTKEEWEAFCFVCLEELLRANREVLCALKNA